MKWFLFYLVIFPVNVWSFDQSHTTWDQVLKAHVKTVGSRSKVDYKSIKEGSKSFENYLNQLSSLKKEEFSKFKKDEKLAFWLNSYNAYTLKLIIDNYPVKSIKKIGGWFSNPWKKKFFKIFDHEMYLDKIEHEIIRKEFDEPRIHFALVCAAKGCPKLHNEAFIATNLDNQLEKLESDFLNDSSRNTFDKEKKEVKISKIFKWYGDDFKNKHGSLRNYLAPFLGKNDEDQKVIKNKDTDIEYFDYDWDLNESIN